MPVVWRMETQVEVLVLPQQLGLSCDLQSMVMLVALEAVEIVLLLLRLLLEVMLLFAISVIRILKYRVSNMT